MEEKLWNGEYYRLYNDEGGTAKGDKSEGCLTDQIIGQWVAHLTGLGYLFKEEHVKSALKKVLDFSYKPDFGLRNCTWPEYPDRFPIEKSDLWVDQANTTWSGVELAFASFLIYEGFYKEGLEVAKTVNTRYRKASLYWDHQEFGGHYYRPMSAWGIVNALLGMSVNQDEYTFNPKIPKKTFRLFFSTAKGTSHYIKEADYAGIESLTGELTFKKITFNSHGLNGKAFKAEVPGNRAYGCGNHSGRQYRFGIRQTIYPACRRNIENQLNMEKKANLGRRDFLKTAGLGGIALGSAGKLITSENAERSEKKSVGRSPSKYSLYSLS